MGTEVLVLVGRSIAKFGVGALIGNVGATTVVKNLATFSDKKLLNKVMTGVGACILADIVTNAAADHVEGEIRSWAEGVEFVKGIKENVTSKLEKGDTNGQQISEQQQISSAADGGEPGEASGEN